MTVFQLRTLDINVRLSRLCEVLPQHTDTQEKRSTQKLSSDNPKSNSNLEDLDIDRQGNNEADDSVYVGYITFELELSFSGRSAIAKLQWNIEFHRTA